jgi:hypothetical protein
LVDPNILEGEKLITGPAKHMAAFTMGHLTDQKVSPLFIQDFLKKFVDPQLIRSFSVQMGLQDTDPPNPS